MNRQYNRYAWFAFLIGLGYKTQVYLFGCIGISEVVVFLLAPILFVADFHQLKRDGFMPILTLCALTMFGCLLSATVNRSGLVETYKAFAMIYSMTAAIIVFHRLLSVNPNGVGWYLLGYAISSVITVWAFHPKANIEVGFLGHQTSDELVGGVMFWIKKVREFAIIPLCLWYFKTPIVYSMFMPVSYGVYCMLASSSGRSMALGTIGATVLVAIGRKSRWRMNRISKYFILMIAIGVVVIGVFNYAYKKAALSGVMGDAARAKYEMQSKMGDSAIRILVSGRKEFFISLPACLDNPIVGLGPRCLDTKGYVSRFLGKYGTPEESAYHQYMLLMMGGVCSLPCHSHITSFWLWFGIFGLLFWLYVILLCFQYFLKYISAVPQWFGYFSLSIPMLFWDMFFSPFNWRMNTGVLLTALTIAKAVGQGWMRLPWHMENEAVEYSQMG